MLNDLDSTDGTWVKIFDLNLTTESRERVYRVSDYEFVILNSTSESMSKRATKTDEAKPGKHRLMIDPVKPLKIVIRKRGDKTNQKSFELNKDKI